MHQEDDRLTYKLEGLIRKWPDNASNINTVLHQHHLSSAVGTSLFKLQWIKRSNGLLVWCGPPYPGIGHAKILAAEVRAYTKSSRFKKVDVKRGRKEVRTVHHAHESARSLSILWGLFKYQWRNG